MGKFNMILTATLAAATVLTIMQGALALSEDVRMEEYHKRCVEIANNIVGRADASTSHNTVVIFGQPPQSVFLCSSLNIGRE